MGSPWLKLGIRMWDCTFWILIAMLHWAAGQIDPPAPICAIRCWENTKYVSKCMDDNACLCTEAEYQNSVFQCLYSQCDTAHFSSALHHAISQCSAFENHVLPALPPVLNHDSLRRREAEYLAGTKQYGSGSVVDLPTQSPYFQTQSASYPTQSIESPYFLDIPPYFPLNTVTGPAITSATPTLQDVAASVTSGPILFTGIAPDVGPYIALHIFITAVTLYLAF